MSEQRAWWQGLRNEPLRIVSVLQALLAAGVSFGLDITVEQQTSILAAAGAVVAMLEVARSKSVPARKLTGAELEVVAERRDAPLPATSNRRSNSMKHKIGIFLALLLALPAVQIQAEVVIDWNAAAANLSRSRCGCSAAEVRAWLRGATPQAPPPCYSAAACVPFNNCYGHGMSDTWHLYARGAGVKICSNEETKEFLREFPVWLNVILWNSTCGDRRPWWPQDWVNRDPCTWEKRSPNLPDQPGDGCDIAGWTGRAVERDSCRFFRPASFSATCCAGPLPVRVCVNRPECFAGEIAPPPPPPPPPHPPAVCGDKVCDLMEPCSCPECGAREDCRPSEPPAEPTREDLIERLLERLRVVLEEEVPRD